IEVSDIREMLYRTFYNPQPGSDGVKVLLKDDRKPDRYFVGYTEDINTDQFSRDTSVQIAMVCMDSYLFSDAVTADSEPAGWTSTPIQYDGSARTGRQLTLKVNAATNVLTVDLNGNKMVLNRAFAIGNIVTIDTRKGNRSIKVGATDIMAALTPESEWIH